MCWRPSAARQTASRRSIAFCLRNWTVNGGANVAAARSERQDEAEPEIERRLHPGLFFVDPTNAEGIERLLQLADARRHPGLLAAAPAVARPSSPARPERRRGRLRTVRQVIRGALSATLDRARRSPRGLPAVAIHRPYPFERSGRHCAQSRGRDRDPTAPRPPAIASRLPAGSRWPAPPIVPPCPASSSRTSSNRGQSSCPASDAAYFSSRLRPMSPRSSRRDARPDAESRDAGDESLSIRV